MKGYFALVLHAHLPFVRHPEHEKFLEENWLFEAITETYIPLIQIMDGWLRDGMDTRLTLTLSPTLCSMLLDPLLQDRYQRHLDGLIELAEKEIHRTHWDQRLSTAGAGCITIGSPTPATPDFAYGRNLVGAFRKFQEQGKLEIITCAATHALLPLLASHPPSIRAQILVARDHYRSCFGCDPRGIWLPECAYVEGVENFLQEANIRWFIIDTHGMLHARPRPRYGVFAPIFTPNGIAAFGRDLDSARQVWSKHEGYPGDLNYRDFYRDIGFDLDFDYVKPHLPGADQRGFTGIKYHRITGDCAGKAGLQSRRRAAEWPPSTPAISWARASGRSSNSPPSWTARRSCSRLTTPNCSAIGGMRGRSFWIISSAKRITTSKSFRSPRRTNICGMYPTQQVARPSASSWGSEGYWNVWLNETNEWIYPHLHIAQERMTELARQFPSADRPEGARPQTSRPRTAPGPGERLAVHPPHRHQPRLRPQTRQGPSPPFHRPARATHREKY